jgi:hypothetical protein
MGNSTTTLQMIVDSVSTIGDLRPILLSTGGFSQEPAVTMGNDVMMELLSERFPWKWNRFKLPPFYINSRQQDYPMVRERGIGWLENGFRVDANSPHFPPSVAPLVVVRDLPVSRADAGWPVRACWLPNDQLEWGTWPGANVTFYDPKGHPSMPSNPWQAIEIADGSLLKLTKYGITGSTAPTVPEPPTDAPDDYPIGVVIEDGTVEWTVCDPKAQGIRLFPQPPDSSANIWLIRLFAQRKAQPITDITKFIEPIPDDQVKWFRDGFIAYGHRYSDTDKVRARYPQMKSEWLAAMTAATKEADREEESYGFFPDRSIMAGDVTAEPGPGNPFARNWGGA